MKVLSALLKAKKIIKSHTRRLPIEFLNTFINHDSLFWLIGRINERTSIIKSIFFVYPASEKYSLAYLYPKRIPQLKWSPWPCGFIVQNRRITLMFCITATNKDFKNPDNFENLKKLEERAEKIRNLFCSERKTYAGILPGVLYNLGIIKTTFEADLTALAIMQAIGKLRMLEDLALDTPIIVLGGKGFVGQRACGLLRSKDVYSIDIADGQDKKDWPMHLKGEKVIVLNIARNKALYEYLDVMWPGTHILNEVYPAPYGELLEEIKKHGLKCYHIVGVEAFALPSFPEEYEGGAPCCAARQSKEMNVIIKNLLKKTTSIKLSIYKAYQNVICYLKKAA